MVAAEYVAEATALIIVGALATVSIPPIAPLIAPETAPFAAAFITPVVLSPAITASKALVTPPKTAEATTLPQNSPPSSFLLQANIGEVF